MNISNHGVYFATDRKLPSGGMIQVHLKMPREVVGNDVAEWCFTGHVAMSNPWAAPMKSWVSAYISFITRFLTLSYSCTTDNPIDASRVHNPQGLDYCWECFGKEAP
jgi:hypothetical protein